MSNRKKAKGSVHLIADNKAPGPLPAGDVIDHGPTWYSANGEACRPAKYWLISRGEEDQVFCMRTDDGESGFEAFMPASIQNVRIAVAGILADTEKMMIRQRSPRWS